MAVNQRLECLFEKLFPLRPLINLCVSVSTIVVSLLLAFLFRFEFTIPGEELVNPHIVIPLFIGVKLVVFHAFRVYNVMWRYVSISDMLRIFAANFCASAILALIVFSGRAAIMPGFPFSVIPIDFLLCFLIMTGKRMMLRAFREAAARAGGSREVRTLLVGKLAHVDTLVKAFSATASDRRLVGILCDDLKQGQSLRGVPVLGRVADAAAVAAAMEASEILLLPPYAAPASIRAIVEGLERISWKCGLRMVPNYLDVAEGNIDVSHIRNVEIEDLLGRRPVALDRGEVAGCVRGKVVMVTGAGGSIGAELCRQLIAYNPAKMVLFELCEYNLYDILGQVERPGGGPTVVPVIGDVRSPENLRRTMATHQVEVVFHAAAYKHVPLMEANPVMAFDTNVGGTSNVAEACEREGVKRMVMISTDKAVRPTSVMGASKRVAERMLLERPNRGVEFVVVRFGNVLGSSGSVIPLFKKQIAAGGPVTVTSKEMTRYFMSIPEAVDLVLQAGSVGGDRDIMVLEMGSPVRIYDMARKLIELSGFSPDIDIKIEITGMRPGEKEYEELMTDEEKTKATPFDRIHVARRGDPPPLAVDIDAIRAAVTVGDEAELIKIAKNCIPEHQLAR